MEDGERQVETSLLQGRHPLLDVPVWKFHTNPLCGQSCHRESVLLRMLSLHVSEQLGISSHRCCAKRPDRFHDLLDILSCRTEPKCVVHSCQAAATVSDQEDERSQLQHLQRPPHIVDFGGKPWFSVLGAFAHHEHASESQRGAFLPPQPRPMEWHKKYAPWTALSSCYCRGIFHKSHGALSTKASLVPPTHNNVHMSEAPRGTINH